MRQSDKLRIAQFMKMSFDEGREEGFASGEASKQAENVRKILNAEIPENYKNIIIAELCN